MNNSNDMQEVNVANILLGALCILVTAPFWMVMTICLMIANLWFAFKEFVLENEQEKYYDCLKLKTTFGI